MACSRDHAEADRVVVAAGDQRRARRRAERGGMELRVAQARFREPIHRRRRDDAAKGAGDAVALIVGHDQQHVGRALGGTIVGGQEGFESVALRLIVPPNAAAELGMYLPSIVVVALGEPGMPVVWTCARVEGVMTINVAANIPLSRICIFVFMGLFRMELRTFASPCHLSSRVFHRSFRW